MELLLQRAGLQRLEYGRKLRAEKTPSILELRSSQAGNLRYLYCSCWILEVWRRIDEVCILEQSSFDEIIVEIIAIYTVCI